jgi:hypothetical protein
MNPFLKLRYKARVGFLLAGLLTCLLLNNIIGGRSITEMEANARSLYADRLIPSTYIFDITEHLHKELALLQSGQPQSVIYGQERKHELAITKLIAKYELTVLSKEERVQWLAFKSHLNDLRNARYSKEARDAHFEKTLQSLYALNEIQASEGSHLQANMKAISGSSSLRSYLEMVLLIVIGGVTLKLIGVSKDTFEQQWPHKASLN